MIATSETALLEDAGIIAEATVADAGCLLAESRFQGYFAALAMNGAWAAHALGVVRRRAWYHQAPASLSDLGAGDRKALEECTRYHLEEHAAAVAWAERDDEDTVVEVEQCRLEVARAERVLAALEDER